MSGLDKFGNAAELTRVMASDCCAGCGAVLMPGAECLSCAIAKGQVEQGEPAWDEFRQSSGVRPVSSDFRAESSTPVPVEEQREEFHADDGSELGGARERVLVPRAGVRGVPLSESGESGERGDAVVRDSVGTVPGCEALALSTHPLMNVDEILGMVEETRRELVSAYERLARMAEALRR